MSADQVTGADVVYDIILVDGTNWRQSNSASYTALQNPYSVQTLYAV